MTGFPRKTVTQWVLVANAGKAFVYAVTTGEELELIKEFENPSVREKEQDLVSDRSGKVQDPKGFGPYHVDPKNTRKSLVSDHFAKSLSVALQEADSDGEFSSLYLVAAPKFLSRLRNELHPSVRKKVVKETDKDITHYPIIKMRSYLSELMAKRLE